VGLAVGLAVGPLSDARNIRCVLPPFNCFAPSSLPGEDAEI